ncbi:YbfB/YjiJ family MFS transporter, partial [Rhizobium johnstonii]|uniref:YbfB/YjiJ family MFS transporter n=1 Tax=Rhizobium johnstonii TaxID=3019933 RepID=UPI003F960B3E
AGFIASANFVVYLVGAVLAAYGWAAGRERPVALLSLLATAILHATMATTDSFAVFAIIRFLAEHDRRCEDHRKGAGDTSQE